MNDSTLQQVRDEFTAQIATLQQDHDVRMQALQHANAAMQQRLESLEAANHRSHRSTGKGWSLGAFVAFVLFGGVGLLMAQSGSPTKPNSRLATPTGGSIQPSNVVAQPSGGVAQSSGGVTQLFLYSGYLDRL